MNLILGLDISITCTGFALIELESGDLVRYGNIRPPKKGELYDRIDVLVQHVRKVREESDPIDVWAEAMITHARHGAGMANLHRCWGAVVQKGLLKEPGAVYPAEIKRLATGSGSATKSAMIAATEARWDVEIATDDEADACWAAESGRLRFMDAIAL